MKTTSPNTSPNPKKRWPLFVYGSLAAVAIGFLIFFLIPEPVEEYTPEDLYMANFKVYPLVQNSEAAFPGETRKALQLYQEKEYLAAADSLENLPQAQKMDDHTFYQSVAQLVVDKNTDAIINLSTIIENDQTRYKQQARWYLAMAYLKIGAKEEAQDLLQKLAEQPKSYNQNRAKAILKLFQEQKPH